MAKKKLPLSIFEIVWYSICVLVMIWGLVYVILGLIDGANDLTSLHKFMGKFQKTFGLTMYFWGLIIFAIGVVAGVTVMIVYAKTFDKAADREQRRSARLSAIKKEEKVVAEQKPEVVEEPQAPVEQPKEEKPAEEAAPAAEAPVEQPAPEEKAE